MDVVCDRVGVQFAVWIEVIFAVRSRCKKLGLGWAGVNTKREEKAFGMWGCKTEGWGLPLLQGLLILVSPGRYPGLGTEKRILYVCVLSVRAEWALDSGYRSQAQQDWRIKFDYECANCQMPVVSVTGSKN